MALHAVVGQRASGKYVRCALGQEEPGVLELEQVSAERSAFLRVGNRELELARIRKLGNRTFRTRDAAGVEPGLGPLCRPVTEAIADVQLGDALADHRIAAAACLPRSQDEPVNYLEAAGAEPLRSIRALECERGHHRVPGRARLAQAGRIRDAHVGEEHLVKFAPPVICRSGRTSIPGEVIGTRKVVNARVRCAN